MAAGKKANLMLGIIRKETENKHGSIVVSLYISMAHLHVGSASRVGYLHFKNDVIIEMGNQND